MKFGVCHLVVINDGNLFKGDFVTVCNALDLNYNVLYKRSYKGLTVEHFCHLLNNAVTITMADRKSNDFFVFGWDSCEKRVE